MEPTTTTMKTEQNYNRNAFACISVNYGECVQLIILFLYHLQHPKKKRWDNFFDATESFCVFVWIISTKSQCEKSNEEKKIAGRFLLIHCPVHVSLRLFWQIAWIICLRDLSQKLCCFTGTQMFWRGFSVAHKLYQVSS